MDTTPLDQKAPSPACPQAEQIPSPKAHKRFLRPLFNPKVRKLILPVILSGISALAGWGFHLWSERAKPSLIMTSIGFSSDGISSRDIPPELSKAFENTRWITAPETTVTYSTLSEKERKVQDLLDGLLTAKQDVDQWQKNMALHWLNSQKVSLGTNNITPHFETAADQKVTSTNKPQKLSSFLSEYDPLKRFRREQLQRDDDAIFAAWRELNEETLTGTTNIEIPTIPLEDVKSLATSKSFNNFEAPTILGIIQRTNLALPVPFAVIANRQRLVPVSAMETPGSSQPAPGLALSFGDSTTHFPFNNLPTQEKIFQAMFFVESLARGALLNIGYYNQQFLEDADVEISALNDLQSAIRKTLPAFANLSLRIAIYNDGATAVTFRPNFTLRTEAGQFVLRPQGEKATSSSNSEEDVSPKFESFLPVDTDAQYIVVQPHESKNVRLLSVDPLGENGSAIYSAFTNGTLRCLLEGMTYKGKAIKSKDTVFGDNIREEDFTGTKR